MKREILIELEDTEHTERLSHQERVDIIEGALIDVGFKAILLKEKGVK